MHFGVKLIPAKGKFLLGIQLPSDPWLLGVVRTAVERLTEEMGFAPDQRRALVVAVDEALANIIRHAYESRSGQPIELHCRQITVQSKGSRRSALEIALVDQGVPMDPKACSRSLDDVRPGGLGLHLIRNNIDFIKMNRVGRYNHLRLVKYLPPCEPDTDVRQKAAEKTRNDREK